MKRLSVNELTRLAFIYAEADRESYLNAWRHCDDVAGKQIVDTTTALLEQLRAYRLKRWGRTLEDRVKDSLTQADIGNTLRNITSR